MAYRKPSSYWANRKKTQEDLNNPLERYGLKGSGAYSSSPRHIGSWDEVKQKSGPVYRIVVGSDGIEQRVLITDKQLPKLTKKEAKRRRRQQKRAKIGQLTSMPYPEYLKTPHWKHISSQKLKLVGYRCQRCGKRSGLNVNHLTYKTRGCERMKDLTVFCDECHKEFHRTHRIGSSGRYVPRSRYLF